MAQDRPIVIFPVPIKSGRIPVMRHSAPGFPSHKDQCQRLDTRFEALRVAIDNYALGVGLPEEDIGPDRILVFEVSGRIDEFIEMAEELDIEWLGASAQKRDPIFGFSKLKYDKQNRVPIEIVGKPFDEMVYATLPSLQGIKELLRLWALWKADRAAVFPEGFSKMKEVFSRLVDLRRWGVKDRISAEARAQWEELSQEFPTALVKIEVEFWPTRDPLRRRQTEHRFKILVGEIDGKIIGGFTDYNWIGYHAVIVEIEISKLDSLLKDPNFRFANADEIKHFGPRAQIAASISKEWVHPVLEDAEIYLEPPTRKPIVALLDGLPLVYHEKLRGRLVISDPADLGQFYRSTYHQHGTAMASLIIYGDLEEGHGAINHTILAQPILKPFDDGIEVFEKIPDDILFAEALYEAVTHIAHEGEDSSSVLSQIQIINLSVGDESRPFSGLPSAAARMVDWLSAKYNILFIVSAGNVNSSIHLEISAKEYANLSCPEKDKLLLMHIQKIKHRRKIISPAESINALTVGSTNDDKTSYESEYPHLCVALAEKGIVAPYSPRGLGHRRAIKPDILMPGGRALFRIDSDGDDHGVNLRVINHTRPLGQKIAWPGEGSGVLNAERYSCGTSNSAALTTRLALQIFDILDDLRNEIGGDRLERKFLPPLIKALIIHGASWTPRLEDLIKFYGIDAKTPSGREEIASIIGHGISDPTRVLHCSEDRITLIGFGELRADDAHQYSLPLPSDLSGKTGLRRISTTLAWISPINSLHSNYQIACMNIDFLDDPIANKFGFMRKGNCSTGGFGHSLNSRGTTSHEIWESDVASVFPENTSINFKINCRQSVGKMVFPVPYGLAVTFELEEPILDQDGIIISIYDKIVSRIRPRVLI